MNDVTDLQSVMRKIVGMPEETRDQRRVRQLECAISRFCQFAVDTNVQLGAGRDFNREFEHLCEEVGFDADEYREQGYRRNDV